MDIIITEFLFLEFLFYTINNRIKALSSKNNFDNIKIHNDILISDSIKKNKRFFTVPYFKNVSEKFKTITQKFNFNLAYKLINL